MGEHATDSVTEVTNPLCCLQIKLYSADSSGLRTSFFFLFPPWVYMHGPECILWRRMRQNRGGISGMKCCVLDPAHAQGTHLVQKNKKQQPRDIKAQRLWKRWPVILLLPRPLQPAEPLSPGVWSVCGAWRGRGTTQRTWKAQQTSRHWHANIHTHTHFFSLSCVSLSQPFIALFWSKRLKTQKPTMHTLRRSPPPHPAPRVPFISIMERRKVPAQDCRWHLHQPCIFEGASQSVYPTKFAKAPLLKRRRRKRSCLNNESARWNELRPRCLSEFLQIFTSGGRGSDHRSNMARRTTS